jgi:uncharacterized protein (TIGR00299 family) protein
MKIAYFDCFSGAGGDMITATMLDAGLDAEFLKKQIATLGIKDLKIEITPTKCGGFEALSFVPVIAEQHSHRKLQEIIKIIQQSGISSEAKKTAIKIFERLADAEATVHGKEANEIHFHEVGAVDSIVDIVSASVGLDYFRKQGLGKIYCSTISIGGGTIKSTHGLLPVPAPATGELIKGVPVAGGPIEAELLTPTAAAILTTIVDKFCELPAMKVERIGYGAGTLESDKVPNCLRLIIGEAVVADSETADTVYLLETNIDDLSGEVIGYVTEQILNAGALDVFTTPIYMKQNRPAVKLSVICKIEDVQKIEQLLFEQGITFGIRRQILQRSKLAREFVIVKTEYGDIKIKVGKLSGKVVTAKPEFSDCAKAAQKHKVAAKLVCDTAMKTFKKDA